MVQRGVEAEREAHDKQWCTDLDLLKPVLQVRRRECSQHHAGGQRASVESDRRDVDVARRVAPLMPDGLSVAVQQDR